MWLYSGRRRARRGHALKRILRLKDFSAQKKKQAIYRSIFGRARAIQTRR